MPKVSAIVPTYNCASYLKRALESVLNQTFKDCEIIVIDDGSTDNTKDVVVSYQNANPDKIVYIYQENQGVAVARNTGIRAAQGTFVALLDADDSWLPRFLEESVCVLESDPSVGLVHANITRISEDGKEIGTPQRDVQFLSGNIFEHIFLRRADVACPTVMFRKSCCDELGLFDAHLSRLGCEDREMWLRMAQRYKFAYIDQVLALYLVRTNSMSRNYEKMLKARLYVIDKFCPGDKNQHLKNLATAKVYRDLGDEFLFKQAFDLARANYIKSIALQPFSLWPWINLVKTLLNVKVRHVS